MAVNRVNVTFENDEVLEVEKNTTLYELSKIYQPKMKEIIVGAEINNEVVPLETKISKAIKVKFIGTSTQNGYNINKHGLEFVTETALKEIYGLDYEVSFDHSIANGLHMTISGPKKFTFNDAKKLKAKMNEIIVNDEKIQNLNVEQKEAISYFKKVNQEEKVSNMLNLTNNIVTMYKLRNCLNFFYSGMPYSTGVLKKYDLVYLGDNRLVLLFPSPASKFKVPEYVHYQKVIKCFDDTEKWLQKINLMYLADLNNRVSSSQIEDLVLVAENNFNNQIHDLVEDVIKRKSRYILFAGPSSSGKTTTTKKVALQLRSKGFETLVISVDDYFKNREDTPKDKNGNIDFECLGAVDVKLLNKHLKDLIDGKKVALPTYNFNTGKREFNSEGIKLPENAIVLIEGLHAINDDMTPYLDKALKYKVYLSPFISLNVDRHNYISTTDLRLLRRIVRDNRSRSTNVGKTIEYWNMVRSGEEKYIYPFIDAVDKVLNTSLVYELGVLKVFVEPLLFSVKRTSSAYAEARRLILYLRNFYPIPSDYVPGDSILREFIGKSTFE